MQTNPRFEGVYANLPTPFTDDGNRLDLNRLHALVDFLLGRRIDGIACLLSSGEYPYLSYSERLELAAEVVRYVSGRVPVIVGVSSLTTVEAIAFAVHAEEIGAAAAMVMPMQYWLLRRDEVVDYFCAISRACSLPLGIYDNPGLRGASFTAEMYGILAKEARVLVSKDSSGDITRVSDVVRACGDRVSILHGNHMEMLPAYLLGATGVCTAIASIFPSACRKLYDLSVKEQRWKEAREFFDDIEPVFRFFHEHSLPRCVKDASQILGRPLGPQRKPLTGLPTAEHLMLRELLERHGHAID
ncbi:MAG: dihydrodipicolinate synthase family protein [Steroidobacteraceae bacterium]